MSAESRARRIDQEHPPCRRCRMVPGLEKMTKSLMRVTCAFAHLMGNAVKHFRSPIQAQSASEWVWAHYQRSTR